MLFSTMFFASNPPAHKATSLLALT